MPLIIIVYKQSHIIGTQCLAISISHPTAWLLTFNAVGGYLSVLKRYESH